MTRGSQKAAPVLEAQKEQIFWPGHPTKFVEPSEY